MVDRVCLENRCARKGTGGSNPSLSANAARVAGDDARLKGAELAPSTLQPCGITGREAGCSVEASPFRESRSYGNPSLSANAARVAGDSFSRHAAELARSSRDAEGIKDRVAGSVLKPPPSGMARLGHSDRKTQGPEAVTLLKQRNAGSRSGDPAEAAVHARTSSRREANAALKPPPSGMARLGQSLPLRQRSPCSGRINLSTGSPPAFFLCTHGEPQQIGNVPGMDTCRDGACRMHGLPARHERR